MTKFQIPGAARLLPFLLGISLCAASLAAAQDTASVELPTKTVIGKKNASKFHGIRDRSRDVLEYQIRRKNRDPNVIAEFVGEGVIPGAQVWMYPAGSGYPLPGMTDAKAHSGRASLEVVLKADAYSGGAICAPAPLNIAPYLESGVLEFWVQGAEGQEVFSIGLLDNGDNPIGRQLQVMVNSRSFSKVKKGEWKRIRIPLKAFGSRGGYWSEEINARISGALNNSSISCFSFDIDKERHKTFKIWIDDARLLKTAPGGAAATGSGYALSNEDFQDFPANGAARAEAEPSAAKAGERKEFKK
ncbi:MAG: cellulose-binding domain protein [Fibrobacteres bacterium]|nr:cellulose-binding domain protein [Fibrobacterota bacterium]